jgi:hypothetical protein
LVGQYLHVVLPLALAVLRRPVPEAPIDEDGDLPLGEDDVCSAPERFDWLRPYAVSEARCVQAVPDCEFGASAARAVGLHVSSPPW